MKNNKKNITILSSFPPIKGISDYTVAFVKELEKHYFVDVLNFKSIYPKFLYKDDTKYKNYKMPFLKNTKIHNIITWYNPISWIFAAFKVKSKIIHVQWWSWILAPIYIVILLISKSRKKKIIMTVHNTETHEKSFIKNILNRSVIFFADKIIVHSEQNKKDLEKRFRNKQIKIAPHGIINLSEANISKIESREILKISKDKKVLLFFGSIREYKGLDVLLKSFTQLIKKDSQYFLLIAGRSWTDFSMYQKIIKNYNLEENIKHIDNFIPPNEVEVLFKAADVLVLPYKHFHAQSGVGSLGLNYNLPIITSNIESLKEMTINNNYVFEINDVDDLVMKINNFFTKYKINYDNKDLKSKFSWENIIKNILDFYCD